MMPSAAVHLPRTAKPNIYFHHVPPPSLQNEDAFVTLAVHELATVLVAFQRHPNAMITAAGAGWRPCSGGKWVVILRDAVLQREV